MVEKVDEDKISDKVFTKAIEPFASFLLYMDRHDKDRAHSFLKHFISTYALTITRSTDEAIQYVKRLEDEINEDLAKLDRHIIKNNDGEMI